jgi:hypothetical protein
LHDLYNHVQTLRRLIGVKIPIWFLINLSGNWLKNCVHLNGFRSDDVRSGRSKESRGQCLDRVAAGGSTRMRRSIRRAHPLRVVPRPSGPMPNRPRPERRRHARRNTSWHVVVEVNDELLHLETVNISSLGAKVKSATHLPEGTAVVLHFRPDDAPPLDVSAVVWRLDADGIAFFFVGALE